ncbi:MAG: relaxase/mobilization nuclease domain-containing protein [Ruminococcus sp.]|nr:relaxase/mobilization nuclease domain-containing protein [Ruminococcus sp.]
MAIVHFINSKSKQTAKGMGYVLRYTTQESKTVDENGVKLVTGVNCTADSAYTEFCNTKNLFGKSDGRQYYHFVQSFGVDENITPQMAHEIALRFASESEKFSGFEIVVSTHCDRDHIHSHFVMNSVNAESGKKFHISGSDVEELMNQSDKLCMEYGLSVVAKTTGKPKSKNMSDREYRSAVKRESWKLRLEATIANAMALVKSKEHFIMLMEFEGYKVSWSDSRKHITYTTPEGNKCRDIKLFDNKFLKEKMENEFTIREKITSGFAYRGTTGSETRRDLCTLRIHNGTELESFDIRDQHADTGSSAHRAEPYQSDNPTGTDTEHTDLLTISGQSGGEYETFNIPVRHRPAETFDSDEQFSSENSDGYGETGWENERAIFTESLIREAETQKTYSETYAHSTDTHSASRSLGTDTAFLIGALSEIIDEDDETEDCTTQPVITERKNYMKKRNRNNHDSGMNMNM